MKVVKIIKTWISFLLTFLRCPKSRWLESTHTRTLYPLDSGGSSCYHCVQWHGPFTSHGLLPLPTLTVRTVIQFHFFVHHLVVFCRITTVSNVYTCHISSASAKMFPAHERPSWQGQTFLMCLLNLVQSAYYATHVLGLCCQSKTLSLPQILHSLLEYLRNTPGSSFLCLLACFQLSLSHSCHSISFCCLALCVVYKLC